MSDLATFTAHRAHLLSIAYRMLGEMSAAEDIAQEAWLRWHRTDTREIGDAKAWLSAVTVRLSLDALRKARARRESYVGPWLPEPILPDDARSLCADAPAQRAELASDLSLALLHVLERLSPEERAAFILHDAFDCDYPAISATLGKSQSACRKLVSRARERVRIERPRHSVDRALHLELVQRFVAASSSMQPNALVAMFAPDVVLFSDGGGKAKAARNPIYGADNVARFISGIMRKFWPTYNLTIEFCDINGTPGILLRNEQSPYSAVVLESDGQMVSAIYFVSNPDKLTRFSRPTSPGSSPSV